MAFQSERPRNFLIKDIAERTKINSLNMQGIRYKKYLFTVEDIIMTKENNFEDE